MTSPSPSERFAQVKAVLLAALDLDPVAREAYLDDVCSGDPELRHEVESLLEDGGGSNDHLLTAELARGIDYEASLVPGIAIPDTLCGRFRIESYLAGGGMGQVYRAVDLELDVAVAIKTIRPAIASNPIALRRFKQEVLLARSISHPNVCRIFELWRDEPSGLSFLTMEFLPGETLAARIRTAGAMTPEDAFPLVRQMADALDAAHRAGIIHGDFKSANVMLVPSADGERAVITDFGLAVTREDVENRTWDVAPGDGDSARRSHVSGTPAYMSPEQVQGDRVGPPADLYALGVVIFEMCTGQLPFSRATAWETARAQVEEQPPSPSDLATLDEHWEKTILRLLAKRPMERPATAHEAVLSLQGRPSAGPIAEHSLRAEQDTFVGRDRELATLAERLEGDDESSRTRLLTVLGAGGTGKTRLAQRYGWNSLLRWPGGVWFCDLIEARDITGVALAVSQALGVSLGREDPISQLGRVLDSRGRSLVILDNFEQVVEHADAILGAWISRTTETSFLVTSQERLRLPGEATLDLGPLDSTTRGVELFEVRAWGHRPGFLVDESNRKLISAIVETLDGLPLAIELAASTLRNLTPERLREGLEDRFRLLVGKERGRHTTLEATLDWSWKLLTNPESVVLAHFSVFEGGCTLEAAEAVVDLTDPSEPTGPERNLLVLDRIQSLVDKSWVRAKVIQGSPRLEMYATVREYVRRKLHAEESGMSPTCLGSAVAAERRHGLYFARRGTDEAIDDLARHGGVEKRAALHLELENLIAACRRAVGRSDEEIAAMTFLAAETVLRNRGPYSLSAELGRDVLGVVQGSAWRSRVLTALASASRLTGQLDEARQDLEAALSIHRELGDSRLEGRVLLQLGTMHRIHGRIAEATQHYHAALAIFREIADPGGEAIVLGNLGNVLSDRGEKNAAKEHYETALALFRRVGDRGSEGMMLSNLGNIHVSQSHMNEARELLESALVIHREVHNRGSEGVVLLNLAILYMEMGRLADARRYFESAIAATREVGNRRDEGIALGNLSLVHFDSGDFALGVEVSSAALAIHREVGNRRFEGIELCNLGAHYLAQDRLDPARQCFEEAVAILRLVGDRSFEGTALAGLAKLQVKLGELDAARNLFHESASIQRDLGDPLELARVLCDLGAFEASRGEREAARAALSECESMTGELALTPESALTRKIEEFRRSLRPNC